MKKIIVFLCIIQTCAFLCAQKMPDFKALRYDEDFSLLQKDTLKNWYSKTKFQPLSKDEKTYISFGGDIRYQYFNIKNENWGDAPRDKDGFLFSRLLLHADFHTGKYFRTYLELQSSMANGKLSTSPVDENPLEFHQAFVDINILPENKTAFTFRIGRQEFSYGSQRLIAVRDGPNNRQSFDALKGIFNAKDIQLDLFYSYYVKAQKNIFDDKFLNDNTKFWCAYLVKNKLPFFKNIDLYYLGLEKTKTTFDDGTGKEIRHSIGSRIWNNSSKIKYDIEGLYQFGKFAGKNISAWTLSFNTSYKCVAVKTKPEFGIKTELISGDEIYGDNKLQTFNPLFPRGGYFGLASLIGPANLIDCHPSLTLDVAKKLSLEFDYDIFWRYSKNDGIYTPGVALIYSGKANPYSFIGNQVANYLVYTPNKFLYFRAEFTWFKTGKYLEAAGSGKDILFTGITGQLKF